MISRIRRGIMTPYDVYTTYLAMKKHFTDVKYDFFRYNGKTRSSVSAFNKRRDKYFFERMSRKLSDDEIKMYFIANFIATDNPSAVWVGEIIQNGEKKYSEMSKKHQSLTYSLTQEIRDLFESNTLPEVFDTRRGHPIALKAYLAGELSVESLTILDIVFDFSKKLDGRMTDPVWETVSMKIKKYRPFLNINVSKYKQILREVING